MIIGYDADLRPVKYNGQWTMAISMTKRDERQNAG